MEMYRTIGLSDVKYRAQYAPNHPKPMQNGNIQSNKLKNSQIYGPKTEYLAGYMAHNFRFL